MIAKISRGKDFEGVVNYVFLKGKNTEIPRILSSDFIDNTNKNTMIESFNAFSSFRKDIKEAVWHCSLNLSLSEKLSDSVWNMLIKDFLKKMDLGNHQFIAVKHENRKREHVHLIVNRINYDNEVWTGRLERKRAIKACRELEIEYGLQIVDSEKKKEAHPTKNEIEKAKRTGEMPPKVYMQKIISTVLLEMNELKNKSIFDFIHALEDKEIYAVPNVANTGKMNGFSFYHKGFLTTGGKLGTDFSWTALEKQMKYDKNVDATKLLSEKDRITELVEKHAQKNNVLLEKPNRKRTRKPVETTKNEDVEYIYHNDNIIGKTRAKPFRRKIKEKEAKEIFVESKTCFISIQKTKKTQKTKLGYKEKLFFAVYENKLPISFEKSYLSKHENHNTFYFKNFFLEDFGDTILLTYTTKEELEKAVSAMLDLCHTKAWKYDDIVFTGSSDFLLEAEKQRGERLTETTNLLIP